VPSHRSPPRRSKPSFDTTESICNSANLQPSERCTASSYDHAAARADPAVRQSHALLWRVFHRAASIPQPPGEAGVILATKTTRTTTYEKTQKAKQFFTAASTSGSLRKPKPSNNFRRPPPRLNSPPSKYGHWVSSGKFGLANHQPARSQRTPSRLRPPCGQSSAGNRALAIERIVPSLLAAERFR
jgi:hypothetical protein